MVSLVFQGMMAFRRSCLAEKCPPCPRTPVNHVSGPYNQLLVDRSVSVAADSLGFTQPTLSNALKRLRTTFNDELFVRTSKGMQPTPFVAQLAEPVSQAIGLLHGAINRHDEFDPATSQKLTRRDAVCRPIMSCTQST
jgi:hypothetical protein